MNMTNSHLVLGSKEGSTFNAFITENRVKEVDKKRAEKASH